MNGHLTLLGGHMEQCGGYFIDGPITTAAQQQISISGMAFVASGYSTPSAGGCPAFTTTDSAYIHVTGYNSGINIGQGVQIIRNHAYTSFINWAATGQRTSFTLSHTLIPNPPLQLASKLLPLDRIRL
jgi:hypothetical protein